MNLNEWGEFLQARITQEKGNDAEALDVFEALLAKHPTNPHLQASRAHTLRRLGREQEAVAAVIAARYASLAQTLVGEADNPEAWVATMVDLANDAERAAKGEPFATAAMAW
jgi:predicted Zn-dependent protease